MALIEYSYEFSRFGAHSDRLPVLLEPRVPSLPAIVAWRRVRRITLPACARIRTGRCVWLCLHVLLVPLRRSGGCDVALCCLLALAPPLSVCLTPLSLSAAATAIASFLHLRDRTGQRALIPAAPTARNAAQSWRQTAAAAAVTAPSPPIRPTAPVRCVRAHSRSRSS